MPITGDFDKFNKLDAALKRFGERAEKLLQDAAPEIEELVRTQIASGLTPMGRRWKPTKDGRQALAGIDADVHMRVTSDGFVVSVDSPVAQFHQAGWKNKAGERVGPSRRMLPKGKKVPPTWQNAFEASAKRIKDELKGAVP